MPGRPRNTAKKVAELEITVVAAYQELVEITPESYRKPTGNSTAPSPWKNCFRAAAQFVLAAKALGDHFRKTAGIKEPGPIDTELGEETIRQLRAGVGTKDPTAYIAEVQEAMRDAERRLPGHASIREEVEWVGANMHKESPDVANAPSLLAINMLLDVRADPALRRDFWNNVLSKRMRPGDRKPKPSAFAEDTVAEAEIDRDQHQSELMKRLFGTEMPKVDSE